MNESGIIRRVDELGRVVIPKEIRKSLRIYSGDPVEIFIIGKDLVIRKYAPITNANQWVTRAGESISEQLKKTCIITNADSVIYVSDNKLKDLLEKPISSELNKIIHNKECQIVCKNDGGKIAPIIRGDEIVAENQIIYPIVSQGDSLGCIILFDKDKYSTFNTSDQKAISVIASIIEKSF